jgi:nucleoside-diphosphate-sugar epimerase
VIHAAAIASPNRNPPHVIFANNVLATYNAVEAAERAGVRRFVYLSSETVPGFSYPVRSFHALYAPIDECHPIRPQDAYGLSKYFGELLMDAAVQRSDLSAVSVRPTWVQWEGNIERNLGPIVRARGEDASASFWSYVSVYDVADMVVLAVDAAIAGHEVIYVAAADNANGLDTLELIRRHFGDCVALGPLERPDGSGISTAKARRLLGWEPCRSWRDLLDCDGRLLDGVRERVAAGATGVQRGLAATS